MGVIIIGPDLARHFFLPGFLLLRSQVQRLDRNPPPNRPFFKRETALRLLTFVLVSQPVLTTGAYVAAWPQGDQFLGGDM